MRDNKVIFKLSPEIRFHGKKKFTRHVDLEEPTVRYSFKGYRSKTTPYSRLKGVSPRAPRGISLIPSHESRSKVQITARKTRSVDHVTF